MTNAVLCLLLVASWEHHSFDGKLMANGQRYNPNALIAASWEFPLNSFVRVEDLHNHLSVVVEITDRPNERFRGKRIDLSPAAFEKLNSIALGVCAVSVQPVKKK